jgi:uncharacterized membrane protein YedE/YeeE
MSSRAAGLGIGLVFGVVLSWSGMASPNVIRGALLLEDSYLFLFFASAVLVSTVGLALLRNVRTWKRERPARRHVVGSLLFGIGWGVADACPGPIAAQIGQGIAWALPTLAGAAIGVYLFMRRSEETEPATDSPRLTRGRSVAGAA